MHLKILTPERCVLDENGVDGVYAKSTEGEFGVLPKHLPLVSPLAIAILRYEKGGGKHQAAVMGGMFSTDGESVTVLCDAAELEGEIDTVRAQHAKERAEARLREHSTDLDIKRAELAVARASIRLKLTGHS